jgi:MFS family permease
MPQIKADLQLSDTGLGLLSGLAFSAFNAVFGLYLARVADRGNRRNLIAVCIAIWSAMTALTGQAQSFLQLLFCRIGVGIGEAGCVPPGHSIISARFDMKYRARVLALHSAGAPVGTLIGLMGGGLLAASYGWRDTFLFLGLPGLAIAALVRWTILEPERQPDESTPSDNSTSESLRILFRKRSFRFTVIGFSLGAFALAGIGQWMPTFLMREFGAGVGLAGTWFGLSFGVGSFCGMVGGGILATPLIERDVRWAPWLAAMSYIISIPLNMASLFMPSLETACLVAGLASAAAGFAYGPAFSMIQSVAEPRSRALATAASVFFATFVG